ncbi:Lrp/AsnC family transcriptional regulator [Pedobacter rhizosphaerae]|uniref:Lrp/AsnC family transcriptional regulator, leucine-responsive regulatory protein n=1 Tax=Pedobacter rhizosphaerae TaxID=390241 RepID=A0A1H9PEG7_9SPHI|nr:Lrp/AsnC family transcriptional regulator [Pedobacter rhizosphaerae]SER45983.1 Lrp/AsnC family transcriptional regulator, leucine-responsive regulatory protein [Pedobacter rhizosphaerae]
MIFDNTINLDQVDLAILRLMQENAKISNVALAQALDLAPSAVLERVKKLEKKQVITGYTAIINPVALNLKLLAFISMKASHSIGCTDTANDLAKIKDVQEVHVIAGEDCYLVKVRTADSASLMALMRDAFSKIPNITSIRTTIVLETVKEQSHLVIPEQ